MLWRIENLWPEALVNVIENAVQGCPEARVHADAQHHEQKERRWGAHHAHCSMDQSFKSLCCTDRAWRNRNNSKVLQTSHVTSSSGITNSERSCHNQVCSRPAFHLSCASHHFWCES